MADDWRRDDRDRRHRGDGAGRTGEQSWGRGTDYEGDGTIARRGFGNSGSGYGRGGRHLSERERDSFGGGERSYGAPYTSDRHPEDRHERPYWGEERSRGIDSGSVPARRRYEDYEEPGYGNWGTPRHKPEAERGYRSGGEGRGFWEEAVDEVKSWFGDDDRGHGGQSHRGRGPKGHVRSDERIREDVSDRLTDDPHIDASEIEVQVANREVTLTGLVGSRFEKRHAEDIAESVSGVTHVQNNLRVRQQYGATGSGTTAGAADVAALAGPMGAAGMAMGTTEAGTTRGRGARSGTRDAGGTSGGGTSASGGVSGGGGTGRSSSGKRAGGSGLSGSGTRRSGAALGGGDTMIGGNDTLGGATTGTGSGPQGTGLGGVEVGPQGGSGRKGRGL